MSHRLKVHNPLQIYWIIQTPCPALLNVKKKNWKLPLADFRSLLLVDLQIN